MGEKTGKADLSAVKAVAFDFDGTLVDSYPAITASVNHVRARHGLPPIPQEEVREHVGRGPLHLLTHTVGGHHLEEDLALYRAHHPSVMLSGTRLLPGAAELVAFLKNAGCKLALCSNKPRDFSRGILAHLALSAYFDVILGPEDVAQPKPAPDMLLVALQKLGVSPAEALYIGDMSVDIQTARGAGVPVWVVPTGSEQEQTLCAAKPDRLLMDLGSLLELIK